MGIVLEAVPKYCVHVAQLEEIAEKRELRALREEKRAWDSAWHPVTLNRIISYPIISYHTISYHIISYHIIHSGSITFWFGRFRSNRCRSGEPKERGESITVQDKVDELQGPTLTPKEPSLLQLRQLMYSMYIYMIHDSIIPINYSMSQRTFSFFVFSFCFFWLFACLSLSRKIWLVNVHETWCFSIELLWQERLKRWEDMLAEARRGMSKFPCSQSR